jgi:hypothetical protein
VSAWNVTGVANMDNMFDGAAAFDETLDRWVYHADVNKQDIFFALPQLLLGGVTKNSLRDL